MVYKVSKGGVRSGNTLRGLSSYRARRYTRQACIVGRSNLKPIDVPTFLDSHIKDKLISSSLGSTDVALSLNKKKRWLLPAKVGHMIKTGSFNDEKTMVSLLERHKLKRRANCVSFVCNQGRIRHVAPRQKRYFSFNLDNIEQSNRRKKHQMSKIMKQVNPRKVKITKNKNKDPIKTLEVFTLLGSGTVADTIPFLENSKPEYRFEVFYPCPQNCSLTYNPKYTNVHMEFGEEGGMELKSEKKVLKKGRKRRKRILNVKDFETYNTGTVSTDAEEFWDDDSDQSDDETVSEKTNTDSNKAVGNSLNDRIGKYVGENEKSDESIYPIRRNENVLVSLIVQAEKARSLCENKKPRRKKQQSSKHDDNKTLSSKGKQEKVHIIYTNEAEARLQSINKITTTTTSTTTNQVTLKSAKSILKSADMTSENLRAKFGRFFAEAESEPRRFLIDVTEDVQNLVCPYRDAELSAVYTSFLVFVHDGVYDEGLDTFKVIFNSNCFPETEAFKTCIPFEETSIEEIMKRVASTVLDEKEKNLFDFNYDQSGGDTSGSKINFVNDLVRANVMTFRASDEIRRISLTEAVQKKIDFSTSLVKIAQDLDCDIFCDICYENINPTQTWDVCGTKLSKCSHIFCDDCWRSHLRSRLRDGALKMTCPGYDCDETVGPVTMLSLLHVSEVSKFFQRLCEFKIDSSSNSKWCPNRACGRVIKLDVEKSTNDMSLDVTCSCGEEFCFSCLSHPHWPATCEQAEKYDEKLLSLESLTISTDDSVLEATPAVSSLPLQTKGPKVLEVEGRRCPKCSNFIDKNGGCRHISCKCGYSFCWDCFKDWNTHAKCVPNPYLVFEHTLKLKIKHFVLPTVSSPSLPEAITKPVPVKIRQKTTWYRKAIQEKQSVRDFKYKKQVKEMAVKIAHSAHKDLSLKKEILSHCGLEIDDTDTKTLIAAQVIPHVSKFLRSCCEIKQALHHVAEFTFVLLQDTADSVDKRRALRLANDLSGYCSFIRSILETGQKQDLRAAVKRLVDIQTWAKRALTVLLATVNKLKR